VKEYLVRRGRNEEHCIIVEHGALMEYEKYILIYGKTLFPYSKFVVLVFFVILSLLDFNFGTSSK
jgi:hypothetical protein